MHLVATLVDDANTFACEKGARHMKRFAAARVDAFHRCAADAAEAANLRFGRFDCCLDIAQLTASGNKNVGAPHKTEVVGVHGPLNLQTMMPIKAAAAKKRSTHATQHAVETLLVHLLKLLPAARRIAVENAAQKPTHQLPIGCVQLAEVTER